MAEKVRVTYHNGRRRADGAVYCAKHNSRTGGLGDHISRSPKRENIYLVFDENGVPSRHAHIDFDAHEQHIYEALFSDSLNAQNKRYEDNSNYAHIIDMQTYRKKHPLEETILQIGKIEDKDISPQAALSAIGQWIDVMQKTYPKWRCIDIAVHYDEAADDLANNQSGHIHVRAAWLADGKDGLIISERKSLEQMGVERPDTNKPSNRYNHAKMTFTKAARELWIQAVEEQGIDVKKTPEYPGKVSLTKEEFIEKKLKKKNLELQEENKTLAAEASKIADERDNLAEQVQVLETEKGRLKGVLRRLQAILTPISRLIEKIGHIHLWDDKTVLDAVVEDARCEGFIDALEALEKEDLGH